jgi:hypothetical protein
MDIQLLSNAAITGSVCGFWKGKRTARLEKLHSQNPLFVTLSLLSFAGI